MSDTVSDTPPANNSGESMANGLREPDEPRHEPRRRRAEPDLIDRLFEAARPLVK